jgi:hypothetical protein
MTTESLDKTPTPDTGVGVLLCTKCKTRTRARINGSWCKECYREGTAQYRLRTRPKPRTETRQCAWTACDESFTWRSTHPTQVCCCRSHYMKKRYWDDEQQRQPPEQSLRPDGTKRCSKCREFKPSTEWSPSQYAKAKGSAYCRDCSHTYKKKWADANVAARSAASRRSRARRLLRQYGAYTDDIDQILRDQGGLCASCGAPPGTESLHIDHCHQANQFRGLLCSDCNRGLGSFKDEPERLIQAAFYLLKHRDPTITALTVTPVR